MALMMPPGGGAELGGVRVRHHLELLDPVLHEGRALPSVVLPFGGGAVHEEAVHVAPLAVDGQAVAVAPRAHRDPRRELGQGGEVAVDDGQVVDLLLVDDRAHRVAGGLEEGRRFGDQDLLGQPSHLQREVHRPFLADAEQEARALAHPEALEGGRELIGARGQVGQEVLAEGSRDHRTGGARARVPGRDRDPGQGAALLVGHLAAQRGGHVLGGRRDGGDQAQGQAQAQGDVPPGVLGTGCDLHGGPPSNEEWAEECIMCCATSRYCHRTLRGRGRGAYRSKR